MSWPGTDPFYNYNSTEANARRSYYGVNAVPAGFVDGSEPTWPPEPNWANAILAETAVAGDATIEVTGEFDDTSLEGAVTIAILPESGINGNYTLQLILVEDDIYYMGSNGYPDHQAVMRDMIPNANGTPISLSAGVTTELDMSFTVPDVMVLENTRLVTFVQNQSTKEVLNAYDTPILSILVDCTNLPGDIIDFGAINVQDLVKLVSIIMGTDTDSEYCQLAAADLNEDGNINIQDVVMLVEMILG